jgi:hypothetical protein
MEFFKGAQHKRAAGKTMIDAGTREVSHNGSAIFEKRCFRQVHCFGCVARPANAKEATRGRPLMLRCRL